MSADWVLPSGLDYGDAVGVYDMNLRKVVMEGTVAEIKLQNDRVLVLVELEESGTVIPRPLNEIRVRA